MKPAPEEEQSVKKQAKPKTVVKYEGSRFSSLILLLVTILVSLALYAL